MLVLSGDQDGPDAARVVSRRLLLPSAFMVHSWPALSTAIERPLGATGGRAQPPPVVSFVSVAPLLTHTSPERTYATRLGSAGVAAAAGTVWKSAPAAAPSTVNTTLPATR